MTILGVQIPVPRDTPQGINNEICFGSLKCKIHIPDHFYEPLDELNEYMNS